MDENNREETADEMLQNITLAKYRRATFLLEQQSGRPEVGGCTPLDRLFTEIPVVRQPHETCSRCPWDELATCETGPSDEFCRECPVYKEVDSE